MPASRKKTPVPNSPKSKLLVPNSHIPKSHVPKSPKSKLLVPNSHIPKSHVPKSPKSKLLVPNSPKSKLPVPNSPKSKSPKSKSPKSKSPVPNSPKSKLLVPNSHILNSPKNLHLYYESSSSQYSSIVNSNGNKTETKIIINERQNQSGEPKITGTYDKIIIGRVKKHKNITSIL